MKPFGRKNVPSEALPDAIQKQEYSNYMPRGFSLVQFAPSPSIVTAPFVEYFKEIFANSTKEEIVRENYGDVAFLKDKFDEYMQNKNIGLSVTMDEFTNFIAANHPKLGRLFLKQNRSLKGKIAADKKERLATIKSIFNEWFNEVNLGVFIDDRNMSVGEIYQAFDSAYNTEGATWRKIRLRREEFELVFKEHLLEKYNYELKDAVSETIS